MPVWTAEVEVTEAEAAHVIAAQFPPLAPVTVRLMGEGWDNTAFVVNERSVFRFPRRAIAAPLLATELALLPQIAPHVPLPIPVPIFQGTLGEWPFGGYEQLAGQTMCSLRLSEAERVGLAVPLAHFLRALHALEVPAPPDTIRRLDLDFRLPRAQENLEKARALGLLGEVVLDLVPPLGVVAQTETLVHGDLYVRHLLVGEDRMLTGVIDWGDLHRGDPAIDLSIAFIVLPPECHAAFCAAYGPIEEATWQVARLRASWHTLTVLLYAAEIEDADLVREAQLTLGWLSEGASGRG